MRQFVNQRDARLALQNGLCVHLLKCFPAVFDLAVGHDFQSLNLCDGVGTGVRLKVRNDDIDSPLRSGVAVRKHLESLSDTRGITQIHLQVAALGFVGRRHSGTSEGKLGRRYLPPRE